MAILTIECSSCSGTGIYRGFAEPPKVGVVCIYCAGLGCSTITYEPFTKRKKRNDVDIVRRSAGTFIFTGVGPVGSSVTYNEFLAGKLPDVNK